MKNDENDSVRQAAKRSHSSLTERLQYYYHPKTIPPKEPKFNSFEGLLEKVGYDLPGSKFPNIIRIAEYKGEQVTRYLLKRLDHDAQEVILDTIKILQIIQEPETIEPLKRLLKHKDVKVRARASEALGVMGFSNEERAFNITLDDIHEELQKNKDNREHAQQTPYYVSHPLWSASSIEDLIKILDQISPFILIPAVKAIGELGMYQAVPKLIELLHHPYAPLRMLTVEALGKLGDRTAFEPLNERFEDTEPDVVDHVCQALGRLGDKRALQLIKDYEDRHGTCYVGEYTGGAIYTLGLERKPLSEHLR